VRFTIGNIFISIRHYRLLYGFNMNATDDHCIQQNVQALVQDRRSMTLATTDGKTAWAAPVYFVFENGVFYFFSDSDTRHIRDIETAGHAAAAVYDDENGWQQLRGLQMTGQVDRIGPGATAAAVIGAYLKKFPFVRDMAPSSGMPDMAFFAGKFRSHLYGLSPETVVYMDNSIRFGFRETISLV